jgi:hypothetical protein
MERNEKRAGLNRLVFSRPVALQYIT